MRHFLSDSFPALTDSPIVFTRICFYCDTHDGNFWIAPDPERPGLTIAAGDCGCSGGIFGESYASLGRVANVIPVDVAIPGCPPTPTALLQGILAALSKAAPPAEVSPGASAGTADG